MSSNTNETWLYQIAGRDIHLYQYGYSANTDTIAGIRIRLPQPYFGNQVIYPDEDITSGLRIEGTALISPFVSEALETTTVYASGTGISFDPGPAATISDTDDGFSDFAQGDKIRVIGSASNDDDYTLTPSGTVDEDTLTITGTFTTEASGERVTITQIPLEDTTPDVTSHVNLNKMLSLAVVDYLKAMSFEAAGDIERKEYYMKEFYGKLGDNESNKRNISVSFPTGPFAIR